MIDTSACCQRPRRAPHAVPRPGACVPACRPSAIARVGDEPSVEPPMCFLHRPPLNARFIGNLPTARLVGSAPAALGNSDMREQHRPIGGPAATRQIGSNNSRSDPLQLPAYARTERVDDPKLQRELPPTARLLAAEAIEALFDAIELSAWLRVGMEWTEESNFVTAAGSSASEKRFFQPCNRVHAIHSLRAPRWDEAARKISDGDVGCDDIRTAAWMRARRNNDELTVAKDFHASQRLNFSERRAAGVDVVRAAAAGRVRSGGRQIVQESGDFFDIEDVPWVDVDHHDAASPSGENPDAGGGPIVPPTPDLKPIGGRCRRPPPDPRLLAGNRQNSPASLRVRKGRGQ